MLLCIRLRLHKFGSHADYFLFSFRTVMLSIYTAHHNEKYNQFLRFTFFSNLSIMEEHVIKKTLNVYIFYLESYTALYSKLHPSLLMKHISSYCSNVCGLYFGKWVYCTLPFDQNILMDSTWKFFRAYHSKRYMTAFYKDG